MKIIYFATPEYACIPLNGLIEAGHEVALIVTTPDKPKGRGNKMQQTPVAIRGEELGIPVLKPQRLRDNTEVFEALRAVNADFIVVYSYGKILPEEVLTAAKFGCVNVHASLLPKYRGAAPIQRAIMDNEPETGITIMKMEKGLDTGDMYAKAAVEIGRKTAADLYVELSNAGMKLLIDNLPKIASGEITAEKQDDSMSSYAEMVFKDEGEIDWTKDAQSIDCLVRAFNDFPVAWTKLGDTVLKIYEVEPSDDNSGKAPGSVLSADKNGLFVACGKGSINIKVLQAPGKKLMDSKSFLLGNKIEIGTVMG